MFIASKGLILASKGREKATRRQRELNPQTYDYKSSTANAVYVKRPAKHLFKFIAQRKPKHQSQTGSSPSSNANGAGEEFSSRTLFASSFVMGPSSAERVKVLVTVDELNPFGNTNPVV